MAPINQEGWNVLCALTLIGFYLSRRNEKWLLQQFHFSLNIILAIFVLISKSFVTIEKIVAGLSKLSLN